MVNLRYLEILHRYLFLEVWWATLFFSIDVIVLIVALCFSAKMKPIILVLEKHCYYRYLSWAEHYPRSRHLEMRGLVLTQIECFCCPLPPRHPLELVSLPWAIGQIRQGAQEPVNLIFQVLPPKRSAARVTWTSSATRLSCGHSAVSTNPQRAFVATHLFD